MAALSAALAPMRLPAHEQRRLREVPFRVWILSVIV